MKNQSFTVVYDGDSLQNHEMDISILAPSLMALDTLLKNSNKIINPGQDLSLNIKGSPKTGCVSIDLIVSSGNQIGELLNLLDHPKINGALNLLAILGILNLGDPLKKTGLLQLIKKIGGEKLNPEDVTTEENGITIKTEASSIYISHETYKLFLDYSIRESVDSFLKPLSKNIEKISIKKSFEATDGIDIYANEYKNFITPNLLSIEEKIDEQTYTTALELLSPDFSPENKWRFSDGNSSKYWISMRDESFLEKVNLYREDFGKNNIFTLKIKRTQYTIDGKLKTDYEAIEVIDIKRPKKQVDIFNH